MEQVSRTFKLNRDYLDTGCKIYQRTTVTFYPGLTVLVGCNGIGKTTLIHQLQDLLKDKGIPTIHFDNLKDGGSNARRRAGFFGNMDFLIGSFISSEGENIHMNLYNFAGQIARFVETNKDSDELWIFMDAVDSGFSVDNIIELKEDLCKPIIEANPDKNIYIIISANEYELAHGEKCFDVLRGKYREFKSYEAYRSFILRTRQAKDKRVYKK